jgi:glyoxylase-like metal-dependent hydrolase (beta-lactamase superfamily II)
LKIDRVLAPNPGPFTGPGTNTWLLRSGGEAIVIDPGPVDRRHADAILRQVEPGEVKAVLVTHTHEDHAPLANPLGRELDVPALGHAPGPGFDPDERVDEGRALKVGDVELRVVHTPGHSDDHLCFLVDRVLFTGDHIMGGSSVMVDRMAPYLESLERVRRLDLERLYPGHGEVIDDPETVIDWYLAHRRQREAEIRAAVEEGASSIDAILEVVYRDVDRALFPLAARSVAAHLEKLEAEGVLVTRGEKVELLVGGER